MTSNVLITGINGFIGSYSKKHFESKGYDVYGIDLFGEGSKNIKIGEVDLANLKAFNQEFDIVIHLAGSGSVSMAQKAPEVEKTKAVGSTEHILEYIKNYNKNARLIFSSSAAVYGNSYKRPIIEDDALNPISIYGFHKLEAEKMCEFYAKNYDLDIKIVRIFSLYGAGLKKQLLWDFANRAIRAKDELVCFGEGTEKRDYIHVLDLMRFFDILIGLDKKFEYYNLASGTSISVKEVMESILRELNLDLKLEFDNIKREGNPEVLISNIDKAKNVGFEPKIAFSEGVKDYIKWFKTI